MGKVTLLYYVIDKVDKGGRKEIACFDEKELEGRLKEIISSTRGPQGMYLGLNMGYAKRTLLGKEQPQEPKKVQHPDGEWAADLLDRGGATMSDLDRGKINAAVNDVLKDEQLDRLDRKMAEFRGWVLLPTGFYEDVDNHMFYKTSNQSTGANIKSFNPTRSIEQAMELVQQIEKRLGLRMTLSHCFDSYLWACSFQRLRITRVIDPDVRFYYEVDPALAICKAVEWVMEEQG
jgi:hypothetical protein